MNANTILICVLIAAGVALVVLIVEALLTVRKARTTIDDIQKQIEPTLANVEQITNDIKPVMADVKDMTAQLKPAIGKVDPLVERVSLTVDAANLEMMRVDQILEDVTAITDSASTTIEAVDNITNAPVELMNNLSYKVRSVLNPGAASDESRRLAQQRAAVAKAMDGLRTAENQAGRPAAVSADGVADPAKAGTSAGQGADSAKSTESQADTYFTYDPAAQQGETPAAASE